MMKEGEKIAKTRGRAEVGTSLRSDQPGVPRERVPRDRPDPRGNLPPELGLHGPSQSIQLFSMCPPSALASPTLQGRGKEPHLQASSNHLDLVLSLFFF
jgi:hypothetical protein